jgi:hypothetical protein
MEEEFSINAIVQTSQTYFPFITNENFAHLFKLTLKQIAVNLVSVSRNTIRDFLILLYWCKHAASTRSLAVLFGLKKSRVGVIIQQQLEFWATKANDVISMEFAQTCESFFLENCIGAVDGTEFQINAWIGDSYSGKQGYSSLVLCILLSLSFFLSSFFFFYFIIFIITIFFIRSYYTLKYQIIVCLETGRPIHLCGPFMGKLNDNTMWSDSGVANYLRKLNIWVIGDKGYQGLFFFYGFFYLFYLFYFPQSVGFFFKKKKHSYMLS